MFTMIKIMAVIFIFLLSSCKTSNVDNNVKNIVSGNWASSFLSKKLPYPSPNSGVKFSKPTTSHSDYMNSIYNNNSHFFLNSDEIKNETVCKVANCKGEWSEFDPDWVKEAKRRGLDCGVEEVDKDTELSQIKRKNEYFEKTFKEGLQKAKNGDFVEAYRDWVYSARKGHGKSSYNIGVMLDKNWIKQYREEDALFWMMKAGKLGHKKAIKWVCDYKSGVKTNSFETCKKVYFRVKKKKMKRCF